MVIEGGVCHTYLLMEFQEMDPQRGIYQEAYSWSLELCKGFAEIEIFGQMEMNFCMHRIKRTLFWNRLSIKAASQPPPCGHYIN